MKFASSIWVAALFCCVQEATFRRAQVRMHLDALDAEVSDRSPIGRFTEIYDASKAYARDAALTINTSSTVHRSDVQLASNVTVLTGPRQEQSNPTALFEGRHSEVSKDELIIEDEHEKEQSNSTKLVKDLGRDVGQANKTSTGDHDNKQSNTTVEGRHSNNQKDNSKHDKEQSSSMPLPKDRHSDVDKPNKNSNDKHHEESNSTALLEGRHAHLSNVDKLGQKSEAKHGSEELKSTLSEVMSLLQTDNPLAYWTVGVLCLLVCCGCCLCGVASNQEEEEKRGHRPSSPVRRLSDRAAKMRFQWHTGTPASDNSVWFTRQQSSDTPSSWGSASDTSGLLARVISKGKQARGAPVDESYQFGDITRGLIAAGCQKSGGN